MRTDDIPWYNKENVRAVAKSLVGVFRKESFDTAVLEASRIQEEREDLGRLCLYFAANLEKFPPNRFEQMLYDLEPNFFRQSRPNRDKPIYPSWEEALAGATAGENQEPYQAFFVYDVSGEAIVDYVGRDGKSLMNILTRTRYHAALESWFGESLEWKAPGERTPDLTEE